MRQCNECQHPPTPPFVCKNDKMCIYLSERDWRFLRLAIAASNKNRMPLGSNWVTTKKMGMVWNGWIFQKWWKGQQKHGMSRASLPSTWGNSLLGMTEWPVHLLLVRCNSWSSLANSTFFVQLDVARWGCLQQNAHDSWIAFEPKLESQGFILHLLMLNSNLWFLRWLGIVPTGSPSSMIQWFIHHFTFDVLEPRYDQLNESKLWKQMGHTELMNGYQWNQLFFSSLWVKTYFCQF